MRALSANTLAMTVVLAALQGIGPLSTDAYLPSLPTIEVVFDTSTSAVQLTLSAFLIGFAIGQILYGPLSDRIGRRPVLLAGLGVFVLASFLCTFAPNIELLVAGRFLQALGGAGPVVLSRSIVRDLYEGSRAGTELSRMGSIMGFVPMVGPVIGSLLHTAFGWRSTFVFVLVIGIAILVTVALLLPETRRREKNAMPLSPSLLLSGFAEVWRSPGFRAHVAIVCLAYCGLFSFISGASFVLQGRYGLSPLGFGLAFALTVVAYVAGTIIGQLVTPRRGIAASLGIGCTLLGVGGVLTLLVPLGNFGHAAEIVLPYMVLLVGVGLSLPTATAGALIPFPYRAGTASSLMGFLQMVAAASTGALLGVLLVYSHWPLIIFIAASGVAAAAVFVSTRGARAAALEPASAAE